MKLERQYIQYKTLALILPGAVTFIQAKQYTALDLDTIFKHPVSILVQANGPGIKPAFSKHLPRGLANILAVYGCCSCVWRQRLILLQINSVTGQRINFGHFE